MRKDDKKTAITELLRNPTADYRPLPFWSWNDKLDPEMIRFQIREMKKAGMGGFFMHARGGLETEYLSEEWMAVIQAGIDEAEKTGLHSWVYDEEGWPSGFASGKVCEWGDAYHGRWMEMEMRPLSREDFGVFQGPSSVLGLYRINHEDRSFALLDEGEAERAAEEGSPCLVISHVSNPYYIDVLNEEVVGQFIAFTHDAYKGEMPENFDGRFKGFFTDEPRLSGRSIDGDFPWSYTLPGAYKSAYGEALLPLLPALFYPYGEYEQVRYHFWKLVNHLFVHSFMEQISDWCRRNNCKLTGHIMMEESVSTQIANTGGVMPFYEFMDIPGIDWLRRTMSSPVVPKQVSSVAAQLGKKQVLTESFALCGWNAGFEDLKWVAQWQYVNGVNLLCQHLQGFTIRGLRKRDYPPSLFLQQPWWDQYGLFNDYFARLGVLLREGENPVDVLVLHPMRSGWILFEGEQNSRIKELDSRFSELLDLLAGQHIEYHLGDETILSRHGSVSGKGLSVGVCTYGTVIIPEMLSLASSTMDLLEAFAAQGGTIICTGDFPALEEGAPQYRSLKEDPRIQFCPPGDLGFWKENCSPVMNLRDPQSGEEIPDLRVTCRVFEEETYWYLLNNSRDHGYQALALLPDRRELFLYFPVEHRYQKLETSIQDGARQVSLEFEPARSMVLVASDRITVFEEREKGRRAFPLETDGLWHLEMQDLNVLTMDRCRYRIDGGDWQPEQEVIHLFNKLLESRMSCDLDMEFRFESHLGSQELEALNLVVEQAGEFRIKVNGHPVAYSGKGWWKDSSFKVLPIRDFLVKGHNTISLGRQFYQRDHVYRVLFGKNVYETEKNKLTFDVELENIYLTGDFSVKSHSAFTAGGNGSLVTEGPFYLSSLPGEVTAEDLTTKGFVFFSGKIRLDRTLLVRGNEKNRVLRFSRPPVAMIKVLVNDQPVKDLLWAPWEADLSPYLREGENQISLILYGSNRNMLGPHHHRDGEPFSVGPGSFTGEWSWVEKKSEAIPATEEERAENFWDERYAFVPFGLGL